MKQNPFYYDGHLVYQKTSDDGVIEVVDQKGIRSLHFGSIPRQSSMSLQQPYALELSYTRSMMACLLFHPAPRRVLVVGLGGGSLVKFLLHYFPMCDVVVVEKRLDVIEVATQYFQVPAQHPKLTLLQEDGYAFVTRQFYQGVEHYDMLLVDAYDHDGMSESVGVQTFFDASQGLLTADGVLSINLWGSERGHFGQTMQRINQSFAESTLVLPVQDKGNVIAFAMNQFVNPSQLKKLRPLAEKLEDRLQIELPKSLQQLIRQNHSFLSRLFL